MSFDYFGDNDNFDIFGLGTTPKRKGRNRKVKGTFNEMFDLAGITGVPFAGFPKQKPMGDFVVGVKRKRRSKEAVSLGIKDDAENPILGLQYLGNAVGSSEDFFTSKKSRKKFAKDKQRVKGLIGSINPTKFGKIQTGEVDVFDIKGRKVGKKRVALMDEFGNVRKSNQIEDTVIFGRELNPRLKTLIRTGKTKKRLKGRPTPSSLITAIEPDKEQQPLSLRQQDQRSIFNIVGQEQQETGKKKNLLNALSRQRGSKVPESELINFSTQSIGDPIPTGVGEFENLNAIRIQGENKKQLDKRINKEKGKRAIKRIVAGNLMVDSQKQILQKIKGSRTTGITGAPDPDRFDDDTLLIARTDGGASKKFKRLKVGEFEETSGRSLMTSIFDDLDKKQVAKEKKQRLERIDPIIGDTGDFAPIESKLNETSVFDNIGKSNDVLGGNLSDIINDNQPIAKVNVDEPKVKKTAFAKEIPDDSRSKKIKELADMGLLSDSELQEVNVKAIGARPVVTSKEIEGGLGNAKISDLEFDDLGSQGLLPDKAQDYFDNPKRSKGSTESFGTIINEQDLGNKEELSELIFEDGKPVTLTRETELIESRKQKGFDGKKFSQEKNNDIFNIPRKSLADNPEDNFRVKSEAEKDKLGIVDDFGDIMEQAKSTTPTPSSGFSLGTANVIPKGGDGIRIDSDARKSLDVKGFPMLSIVNNIEKQDTNTRRLKISESEISRDKFTQAIADGRITKSGLQEELDKADDRDTPKSTRNRRKKSIRRIIKRYDEFKSLGGSPTPRSDRISGDLIVSEDTKQKFEQDGDKIQFKQNAFRENSIVPSEDLKGSSGFQVVATQEPDKSGKGGIISALSKTKAGRFFSKKASDENKTISEVKEQDVSDRLLIEDRERIEFEKKEREEEKRSAEARQTQFELNEKEKKLAEEEKTEDEENDDFK